MRGITSLIGYHYIILNENRSYTKKKSAQRITLDGKKITNDCKWLATGICLGTICIGQPQHDSSFTLNIHTKRR